MSDERQVCLAARTGRDAKVEIAEGVKVDGGVRLRVRASYPRPGSATERLAGEFTLTIAEAGTIAVTYAFTPLNATGTFLEAGLAVVGEPAASEFRWIGDGPYAGYPGKDRLNEIGTHHLSREDLHFQGNRRNVEVAMLVDPAGKGFLVASQPTDLAVENTAAGIVLSQNAVVSGRGNKGGGPENLLRHCLALNRTIIAGVRFLLLPCSDAVVSTVLSCWPAVTVTPSCEGQALRMSTVDASVPVT